MITARAGSISLDVAAERLQRQRTGNRKAQCIAATVVDIYNKGVERSKRLPSWWKEAE